MSALAVSSGKPYIDPDTSTRNTYSRASAAVPAGGRAGGSIATRK